MSEIITDFEEPILFRTAAADVHDATVTTGSLWLRSDAYYRKVEDGVRQDTREGINSSKLTIPLQFSMKGGSSFKIVGTGSIGQQIVPHYIISLHSCSISYEQLRSFGGCTFSVKSISKLSAEVLYRCSLLMKCTGYRYGAVFYQRATLTRSYSSRDGAALRFEQSAPVYLNPINTDVLRKEPVLPFIEQDEWRIVIFTDGYLDGDANVPLKINVDPTHFYPYQRIS